MVGNGAKSEFAHHVRTLHAPTLPLPAWSDAVCARRNNHLTSRRAPSPGPPRRLDARYFQQRLGAAENAFLAAEERAQLYLYRSVGHGFTVRPSGSCVYSSPHASFNSSAPIKLAPVRSAPLRLAPRRWAPLRLAPRRSAQLRSAPIRLAPLRSAPRRWAPLSLAPRSWAPLRSAPYSSASRRSAARTSAKLRLAPLRLASRRRAALRLAPRRLAPFRLAKLRLAKLRL